MPEKLKLNGFYEDLQDLLEWTPVNGNPLPYSYSVEVSNRFKKLDLVYRVPENYGQRFITLYRRQWPKPSLRKMQGGKVVVWGGFTNSWRKKRSKRLEQKGKLDTQLNPEFQRIARRDQKAFFNEQCNRMGKTRELFRKIGIIKGTFHAWMGMTKDRNIKDLIEAEEIKKSWQE